MSGMQQRGAYTLIQLVPLAFAGTIPQGASATIVVPTPYAKAGDVPLFSIEDLPAGNGLDVVLQEWYCIDGAVCFTYGATSEGGYVFNTTVKIALLRSPGWVGPPVRVPRQGLNLVLDDVNGVPGPGPLLPLWVVASTNDQEVTLAAGETEVVRFPLWGGGNPANAKRYPCQFSGPTTMPGGFAVCGWRVSGTYAFVSIANRTLAPLVVPVGGFGEIRLLFSDGQGWPNDTRSWGMGGRNMGPAVRRHLLALGPSEEQDINVSPAVTIDTTIATGADGQRVPAPQAPAASRLWVTAPKGLSGSPAGFSRLNETALDSSCRHIVHCPSSYVIGANGITQHAQHVDFVV